MHTPRSQNGNLDNVIMASTAKNSDQLEVHVNTLHQHPEKRRQQEVVEEGRRNDAVGLPVGGLDGD